MIKDKNSKNRQINEKLLGICVVASLLLFPQEAWASETSVAQIMTPIVIGWLIALGVNFKHPQIGLIVGALGGLGLSLYLGFQHFDTSAGASICSAGGNFDCAAVNKSPYGKLSGHVDFLPDFPLALVGSAYYIALISVGFLNIRQPDKYKLGGYLVICGGVLSLILSLYLGLISHFKLNKWCLFCIGMYGFNAVTLLSGYLWVKNQTVKLEGDDTGFINALTGKGDDSLSTMGFAFIMVLLLCAIKINLGSGTNSSSQTAGGESWPLEALPKALSLDGTEPVYGDKNAKYTLVEFADYECPHCKEATPIVKKIVDEFQGDVKLLFKHYPLSDKCNKNMDRAGHENACDGALAADCAHEQNKFWEMSHLLFVNQGFFTRDEVDVFAKQLRLDEDKFSICMNNAQIMEGIKADIDHATAVDIGGTPALYFHGIEGNTWYRLTDREDSLRGILKQLKAGQKPSGDGE